MCKPKAQRTWWYLIPWPVPSSRTRLFISPEMSVSSFYMVINCRWECAGLLKEFRLSGVGSSFLNPFLPIVSLSSIKNRVSFCSALVLIDWVWQCGSSQNAILPHLLGYHEMPLMFCFVLFPLCFGRSDVLLLPHGLDPNITLN